MKANKLYELIDEIETWDQSELDSNLSRLPVFGTGKEPKSTSEIWSWEWLDADNVAYLTTGDGNEWTVEYVSKTDTDNPSHSLFFY